MYTKVRFSLIFGIMKKLLWPLLVWVNLLIPATNQDQNTQQVKEEIIQTLSIDGEDAKKKEQERREQHIQNLISKIQEPIILWDRTNPEVSITIDDGYGRSSIEYMLDLFEKKWVKATFFVIWDCLKKYPNLWEKAAQQWHEICNHTQTHSKYFKTWDESERFERELLWREKTLKEVLWEEYFLKMKKEFPFFRFPWMYWIRVKAYLDILKKHGYIPIWRSHTKNPENWAVNNGDIYLRHFIDKDTAQVRKNLQLILESNKTPKTVSDIITSEWYDEPIWWHNRYKKK